MILKELCVAAGKYVDSQGNEKTRWKTIGHLHQKQDKTGEYITLDPAYNLAAFPKKEGDDRLYVNLFDPQPKDGQKTNGKTPPKAQSRVQADDPSDVPF